MLRDRCGPFSRHGALGEHQIIRSKLFPRRWRKHFLPRAAVAPHGTGRRRGCQSLTLDAQALESRGGVTRHTAWLLQLRKAARTATSFDARRAFDLSPR